MLGNLMGSLFKMKTHRLHKPPADNQGWKRAYKKAEEAIQKAYVIFLRKGYDIEIIHLINEGKLPPQYRKLLLALGLRPGASDLICLWKGRGILFHELKADSGRLSPKQTGFSKSVTDKGFQCVTTYGLEEAKQVPEKYGFPKLSGSSDQ